MLVEYHRVRYDVNMMQTPQFQLTGCKLSELLAWYDSLDMGILGDRLQEALDRAGLNQAKLARHLGVTRGTVSNWVNGKRNPQLSHLIETARLLNMSFSEMLGEEIVLVETERERDLIAIVRELSEKDLDQVIRLARLMTGDNTSQ